MWNKILAGIIGFLAVSITCILMAWFQSAKTHQIEYLFHYDLSDLEIANLPLQMSDVAGLVKRRQLNAVDSNAMDNLLCACPYHSGSKHQRRLLWTLNGKPPTEGSKCILVIYNETERKIIHAGFVIIG